MYLDLLLLVDLYIDNHLVLVLRVVALRDEHFGILEAFIVEVALGQGLGTVDDVGGDLAALDHANLAFQVLTFRLLHAVVVDVRHARTHGEVDGEPDLVAFNLVGRDLYVGEEAVAPVALTGLGNLVARDGDDLFLHQT